MLHMTFSLKNSEEGPDCGITGGIRHPVKDIVSGGLAPEIDDVHDLTLTTAEMELLRIFHVTSSVFVIVYGRLLRTNGDKLTLNIVRTTNIGRTTPFHQFLQVQTQYADLYQTVKKNRGETLPNPSGACGGPAGVLVVTALVRFNDAKTSITFQPATFNFRNSLHALQSELA